MGACAFDKEGGRGGAYFLSLSLSLREQKQLDNSYNARLILMRILSNALSLSLSRGFSFLSYTHAPNSFGFMYLFRWESTFFLLPLCFARSLSFSRTCLLFARGAVLLPEVIDLFQSFCACEVSFFPGKEKRRIRFEICKVFFLPGWQSSVNATYFFKIPF